MLSQRLGAINGEYDLLNAELQNEKKRVRMMGVYNLILVALVALLSVAFILLKRYKRDVDVKEIDIVKRKERFDALFEKYRADYKMDKNDVTTIALQNLEKLHEAYPSLTRTEVTIIWLLFMKYSSDSICDVLNITHNYYYQRKSAIYRTLGIKGKDEGQEAIERIVKEYIFIE
jgi:DNA-binding CsgD family transcriptional regulator